MSDQATEYTWTLKRMQALPLRRLLEVKPSVPIDETYRIPIYVTYREFDKVTPTLETVGNGALRLSLDKPFGFFTTRGEQILSSQKVDEILLAETSYVGKWQATVHSLGELTGMDIALFDNGINLYADHTAGKLRKAGKL